MPVNKEEALKKALVDFLEQIVNFQYPISI